MREFDKCIEKHLERYIEKGMRTFAVDLFSTYLLKESEVDLSSSLICYFVQHLD